MTSVRTKLLCLFFCFISLTAFSQISLNYLDAKKNSYTPGDLINLEIILKCRPETCLDGMKQTKIFVSGLEIEKQTAWKERSKGTYQKEIQLKVVKGKKKQSKLTILRKVDKESLFKQEILPVINTK